MAFVDMPVLRILTSQHRMLNHQHVLGIMLLSGPGEVEAARNHRITIDDHDLVVGDSVLGVDQGADACMGDEVGLAIFLGPLGFVQDHFDMDTTLMRIHQGFGNRFAGEAVCLDQDVGFGLAQLLNHRLRASTMRGGVHMDVR